MARLGLIAAPILGGIEYARNTAYDMIKNQPEIVEYRHDGNEEEEGLDFVIIKDRDADGNLNTISVECIPYTLEKGKSPEIKELIENCGGIVRLQNENTTEYLHSARKPWLTDWLYQRNITALNKVKENSEKPKK